MDMASIETKIRCMFLCRSNRKLFKICSNQVQNKGLSLTLLSYVNSWMDLSKYNITITI